MKMSKKEILAYILVAFLVLTITFSFFHFFAFEKNNSQATEIISPSPELIKQLYDYIPNYRAYYNKYQNLNSNEIGKIVYNYILKYEKNFLEESSKEDALYQIKKENWLNVVHQLFGKAAQFTDHDLILTPKIKATYLATENLYLIYENKNESDSNIQEDREYQKYELKDEGNTLKIYDKYISCDLDANICYNDAEKRIENSYNFINDGVIDLKNNLEHAPRYCHTFVLEDGHYIWFSSELVN